MKKYTFLIWSLSGLFLFSCDKQDKIYPAEYKVIKSNFEDILTIDGYVESLNSQNVVCPSFYDCTIAQIIEDGTYVKTGDVLCVLNDKSVLEEYDFTKMQLANAEAEMKKSKANMQMQYTLMEAQVSNNKAETEIARLDSLQLRFSSENQRKIRELELKRSLIEKERLQKKFEALKIIQQSETRKMELQMTQLNNRLASAKEKIDGMTIKSPCSGIAIIDINRITRRKNKVGDPVWGNFSLVKIPQDKKMKVKINASEGSFKRIDEKDSVFYTFDAMPDAKGYGRVTKKTPAGKPVKENSNVKIFEIEASLDSVSSIPSPGFTCRCNIVLKKIPNVVIAPQVAVFEQDSMKVVYVVHGKEYEMRQVNTGISSPKEIIITKGLKEKERITLSKPEKDLITRKTVFKKSPKPAPKSS